MRREVSPGKEDRSRKEQSEYHQRREAAPEKNMGQAAGDNAQMGEILTSAMRHSVGRPAISMEGGTINTYGAACPPPSELSLKPYRETAKSALTASADFVVSNLTMRREYKAVCMTYLPHIDCERGHKEIEIIVHYPEDKEKQRELAKRVALVHAQTVAEKLATLSCPVEQKAALYDEIKKKYIAKSR